MSNLSIAWFLEALETRNVMEFLGQLDVGQLVHNPWLLGGIGALALVRHQGFEILRRLQADLALGHPPAAELLDGALVLVGAVLLLTPGFFTDLLGLLFLIPFTRAAIKQFARLWLQRRLARGVITIHRF